MNKLFLFLGILWTSPALAEDLDLPEPEVSLPSPGQNQSGPALELGGQEPPRTCDSAFLKTWFRGWRQRYYKTKATELLKKHVQLVPGEPCSKRLPTQVKYEPAGNFFLLKCFTEKGTGRNKFINKSYRLEITVTDAGDCRTDTLIDQFSDQAVGMCSHPSGPNFKQFMKTMKSCDVVYNEHAAPVVGEANAFEFINKLRQVPGMEDVLDDDGRIIGSMNSSSGPKISGHQDCGSNPLGCAPGTVQMNRVSPAE